MNNENMYAFLNQPQLPRRLNAQQAGWLLGFKHHEITILVGAKLLEPLGHPPANSPKFFDTQSLRELHTNHKWFDKATDTIYAYWRRKNAKKRAGRSRRIISQ